MMFPATAALFAAVLTARVMVSWTSSETLQGGGGNEGLQKRIRAHGHFSEPLTLSLVVIGLLA